MSLTGLSDDLMFQGALVNISCATNSGGHGTTCECFARMLTTSLDSSHVTSTRPVAVSPTLGCRRFVKRCGDDSALVSAEEDAPRGVFWSTLQASTASSSSNLHRSVSHTVASHANSSNLQQSASHLSWNRRKAPCGRSATQRLAKTFSSTGSW